jgi:hypothetical protein
MRWTLAASPRVVFFLRGVLFAIVPGFILASLFWVDRECVRWSARMITCSQKSLCVCVESISTLLTDQPSHKLLKGSAYHWDMAVCSALLLVCALFGLPWISGALPNSALHVLALATRGEVVEHGRVRTVVVRAVETRLTGLCAAALLGVSIFAMPLLRYIPVGVLFGLFLTMGVGALENS